MSKFIKLDDSLYEYIISNSLREAVPLRKIRKKMSDFPEGGMQIAPDQGQFMAFLVSVLGAKYTLEIGVFTGYSSACIAQALPDDGKIVACDINENYVEMARDVWKEMGVAHKINFHLGPALHTLDKLIAAGQQEKFDFAFIDADKENTRNYYERCLQLVRRGGIIAVDNVLMGGRVTQLEHTDEATVAVREFNAFAHFDERVSLSFLSISDGLMLALKR